VITGNAAESPGVHSLALRIPLLETGIRSNHLILKVQ
jgi:hypothetical protein